MEELKILEQKLEQFDYTYMMSDDHRVWQAGVDQEDLVRALIRKTLKENPGYKQHVKDLILKHKPEYGTNFIEEDEK